jgi:hypothetical protein
MPNIPVKPALSYIDTRIGGMNFKQGRNETFLMAAQGELQ